MTYIVDTLHAFWGTFAEMSPYLLFGFLFAGLLSVLVSPQTVENHLGRRGLLSITKASLFGIPLPLCSCGVIPVAASLRRHGASKGATTAFLISTPQTGVDSILVTFSLLGPVFAVLRPIAALVSGVLGGGVVDVFADNTAASSGEAAKPTCNSACCKYEPGRGAFQRALNYGFVTLPQDIGKPLLVGVAVAALITAFVPEGIFEGRLGSGFTGMLVMMLCGIPMYVCATASVPVAAALIMKGVSPGAALVFLMTGPATNAASIATIWKLMGGRAGALYLASVAVTALGAGLMVDAVFRYPGVPDVAPMTEMLPPYVKYPAAALLLVVLFAAIFKRRVPEEAAVRTAGEKEVVLEVGGMTCGHCAAAVKRALSECAGVKSVTVDLAAGRARLWGSDIETQCLLDAVTSLGYTARPSSGG